MTVKELISLLYKYDEDKEVVINYETYATVGIEEVIEDKQFRSIVIVTKDN